MLRIRPESENICPLNRRVNLGAVDESRSFFQCSEEGARYFWRNASIPEAAYPACVSKFELLSNPRIGVALLPAERCPECRAARYRYCRASRRPMSTRRDCSGDPMGLGTRRIAQRGLSRQTEGSGFHSATILSHKTAL